MALSSLDNPLERLASLPNAMNWRGGWIATEQYYLNDVVVSPVNLASYILNGRTSLTNGGDPTTNPDWIELSATATGVLQVNAGFGIGLDPLSTPTIPTIDNHGVVSIVGGAGIGVANGSGPPFPVNTTISNNGVLSVTAGNAGISVSAPTGAIQISNSGVLSVSAGAGLSLTGTAQNPTLNFALSPTVVSNFFFTGIPNTGFALPPATPVILNIASAGASYLNDTLQNGVLDPNGSWMFDFSGLTLWSGASPAAAATFTFEFQDTSTGGAYVVPNTQGGEPLMFDTGIAPFTVTLPRLFVPVAALRAAGVLALDKFVITNNTSTSFRSTSGAFYYFATYYPNGAQ